MFVRGLPRIRMIRTLLSAILNFVKKRSNLKMDSKMYEATQQVGMQVHEEIDVPTSEVYLRVGIYDLNSGKCGTVGAALNGSSAQLSKK
jgi:hypothetical protein